MSYATKQDVASVAREADYGFMMTWAVVLLLLVMGWVMDSRARHSEEILQARIEMLCNWTPECTEWKKDAQVAN